MNLGQIADSNVTVSIQTVSGDTRLANLWQTITDARTETSEDVSRDFKEVPMFFTRTKMASQQSGGDQGTS